MRGFLNNFDKKYDFPSKWQNDLAQPQWTPR